MLFFLHYHAHIVLKLRRVGVFVRTEQTQVNNINNQTIKTIRSLKVATWTTADASTICFSFSSRLSFLWHYFLNQVSNGSPNRLTTGQLTCPIYIFLVLGQCVKAVYSKQEETSAHVQNQSLIDVMQWSSYTWLITVPNINVSVECHMRTMCKRQTFRAPEVPSPTVTSNKRNQLTHIQSWEHSTWLVKEKRNKPTCALGQRSSWSVMATGRTCGPKTSCWSSVYVALWRASQSPFRRAAV